MDLFRLVGSVFVDTQGANDSLSKTDKKAQETSVTFKDVAGKAAAIGTAVVGAATAAVGGMISMAKKSASTADTIDKASKRMKISTDSYQELAHAASLSGVEMSMAPASTWKTLCRRSTSSGAPRNAHQWPRSCSVRTLRTT